MFQFHLVRLKDLLYVVKEVLVWFQFHLVRLKVLQEERKEIAVLFQFHLVRLKGRRNNISEKPNSVSIPFSTIKRMQCYTTTH